MDEEANEGEKGKKKKKKRVKRTREAVTAQSRTNIREKCLSAAGCTGGI